jgi:hypothetical protein
MGIILAAAITASLGLPMWLDLIVEYATGFGFGLFIFQSLFMKNVMGGTYWENVRRVFLPEFISINAMMAGMGSQIPISIAQDWPSGGDSPAANADRSKLPGSV